MSALGSLKLNQTKNSGAEDKNRDEKEAANGEIKVTINGKLANSFELFFEYGLIFMDCSMPIGRNGNQNPWEQKSVVRVGLTHRRILNNRSEPLRPRVSTAFSPLQRDGCRQ